MMYRDIRPESERALTHSQNTIIIVTFLILANVTFFFRYLDV